MKWTWLHLVELKQQFCCFQAPLPSSLVCDKITAAHFDSICNIHLIRCSWLVNCASTLTPHHFFTVLSPKVLGIAIARYDFCARDMRELSLLKGDVVKIYTKMSANGWWRGEVNGRVSCPSQCARHMNEGGWAAAGAHCGGGNPTPCGRLHPPEPWLHTVVLLPENRHSRKTCWVNMIAASIKFSWASLMASCWEKGWAHQFSWVSKPLFKSRA